MAVHARGREGLSGRAAHDRAVQLIPGGATCYSKQDSRFPPNAPRFINGGYGQMVWSDEGDDYLDWGMGLRSVILGHAYPEVVRATYASLASGANHTRPTIIEGQLAERLTDLLGFEMVAFGKNGSDVTTAAVRLARAATGRIKVLACVQSFFASDDWWLCTTGRFRGAFEQETELFSFNHIPRIDGSTYAAIILSPMEFEWPAPGFLAGLRDWCDRYGVVLIFDEVISGFRFDLRGAAHIFGITPDLACYGKAIANGFSVSALAGKRAIMELADGAHGVHALSSTHGGETHALAAALATIDVLEREDVSGYIGRLGKRLQSGLSLGGYDVRGHPTSPTVDFASEAERLAFVAKLCDRGILAPYWAPSFSHTEADVDRTIEAACG